MASLTELFQFLDSPNPSARHLALQNLVGHTPKNSTNRTIFIPSTFAGNTTGGGGLVPNKRKDGSDEDEMKVKALKDLAYLCMDQAVGFIHLLEAFSFLIMCWSAHRTRCPFCFNQPFG